MHKTSRSKSKSMSASSLSFFRFGGVDGVWVSYSRSDIFRESVGFVSSCFFPGKLYLSGKKEMGCGRKSEVYEQRQQFVASQFDSMESMNCSLLLVFYYNLRLGPWIEQVSGKYLLLCN